MRVTDESTVVIVRYSVKAAVLPHTILADAVRVLGGPERTVRGRLVLHVDENVKAAQLVLCVLVSAVPRATDELAELQSDPLLLLLLLGALLRALGKVSPALKKQQRSRVNTVRRKANKRRIGRG